jgi:putative transcriptional regulator
MITSVIKVRLEDVLSDRQKSLYALAKETGISYNTLTRINKNKVQGITWDVLEKVCVNLDCSPNDLLQIVHTGKPTES